MLDEESGISIEQNRSLISINIDGEVSPQTQEKIHTLSQECLGDLQRFLPEGVLPTEPTVVNVKEGNIHNSAYLGEVGGAHYIQIPCNIEGIGLKENDIKFKYLLAHELVHQKLQEVLGAEPFFGAEFVALSTQQHPNLLSEADKVNFLIAYNKEQTRYYPLVSIIHEGVAVVEELFLLNSWIKEAENIGDQEARSFLQAIKSSILKNMKYDLKHSDKDFWLEEENGIVKKIGFDVYSLGVFNFMKPLYDRFGLEKVIDIVKSIDFKRCAQVIDPEELKNLLEDPRKIPGLENNPLIAASFNDGSNN